MPQDPTVTEPNAPVAIPVQQTAITVTYVQPVTVPAVTPTQLMVTVSKQPQQFPNFCGLCTPAGRQCLNNYLLPIHPEWSDDSEEEEKDLNKQNREEKQEIEDWDSTMQKQKEERELELKQNNMKIPKSCPETMSPLETEDTKVHTPQLTDSLVGKT